MIDPSVRVVLLLLWGAIVSLDERAWGSYMLHQPLVAGTVAGALLGSVQSGLAAGLILQCFWPALQPVGGDLLPAVGLAGVLAGAVAAWGTRLAASGADPSPHDSWFSRGTGPSFLGGSSPPGGPLFFAVTLGLLAAWAGRSWERATRRRNAAREERALRSSAPLGEELGRALRAALADSSLRGVVIVGAGLGLAALLFFWPAAARGLATLSARPVGSSLRLVALALGLGALAHVFGAPRRRHATDLLLGLAAGVALQLLRGR